MFKRPYLIALTGVLLLVVVMLNLPEPVAARVKLAISSLFLPLFSLASTSQTLGNGMANAMKPRRALLLEVEKLRRENDQLRFQLAQDREAILENERLRQMLGFQKQSNRHLRAARVVGRDPVNWWRTLHIDLGSRDGAMVNLPVLANDGLVGRICAVGYLHSQVLLVGDPNCRVAALIQDRDSRENGIIIGSVPNLFDHRLVSLSYLSGNSQVKLGQTVVTSGLGGVFPKGIRIGEIVDVHSVEYGLNLEARVKLAVDFNRLEEVWVLFP
jgi:rod shape-determining protein MreC